MDTTKFQKLLEEERAQLEKTLGSVGQKTTTGGGDDWTPSYPDLNPMASDKSEMADEVEEFENRIGVEQNLEDRLNDVNNALKRITSRAYGKCETCDEKIPEERMLANPAARTCVKHASSL